MEALMRCRATPLAAVLGCVALALVPVLTHTRHAGYYAVAGCVLGGIVLGIRAIAVEVVVITAVGLVDVANGHTEALAFMPVAYIVTAVPVLVGVGIQLAAHRLRH
jgi:hypothetical protein